MKRYQATAIRVCGLATLFTVIIALAAAAKVLTGATLVPTIQIAGGAAVFVAAAAFILANVRNRQAAESVTLIAASTAVVLLALSIYKVVTAPVGPYLPAAPSLNIVDVTLTLGLLIAFAHMCLSVWHAKDQRAKVTA